MKKRESILYVKNIEKIESISLPDGTKSHTLFTGPISYRIGYKSDTGKERYDFISPNLIPSWVEELRYDGYFCFVDTNDITGQFLNYPEYVHATGLYIFKFEHFQIEKDDYGIVVTWNPGRNSEIIFDFTPDDGRNKELKGYQIAFNRLNELNIEKVKIIVDAFQDKHDEINQQLPKEWQLYYTSSDRGDTWFNKIFKRLDSAIRTMSQNNPNDYDKAEIEKFLMCNSKHLLKRINKK